MKNKLPDIPWRELQNDKRPFFLYWEEELVRRHHLLKTLFPEASLYYSVKSNPNKAILRWLLPLMEGFDVSSLSELHTLLKNGVSPARITFSGPGKTNEALDAALHNKIQAIHIDSLCEYEFLKLRNKLQGTTLRISPLQEQAALMSLKLGLNKGELDSLLNQKHTSPFLGLHMYLGRESFTTQSLQDSLLALSEIFQFHPESFAENPRIYLGPGLPANLSALVGELSAKPLPPHSFPLTLEVGRGLVATCGYYAAPVLAVKTLDNGRRAIIIEGGLQHLGGPFQTYHDPKASPEVWLLKEDKLTPIHSSSHSPEPTRSQTQTYSIYGSLCLWHDCLIPHATLPASIQRGDWLLFGGAGAYGLTAGLPFFIGQTLPKEYTLSLGGEIHDVTHQSMKPYHEIQNQIQNGPQT